MRHIFLENLHGIFRKFNLQLNATSLRKIMDPVLSIAMRPHDVQNVKARRVLNSLRVFLIAVGLLSADAMLIPTLGD